MRKFSKIFAVAITLCLIFGVLCTSVLAEELSAKKDLKYPAEGISNVAKIDFEENGNGDSSYASSKTSGAHDSTYGWGAARTSTIQDTLVKTQIGLDGVMTNNYLRHSRLEGGGSTTQSAPYWEYYIGKYSTPTHIASDYSFVMADYDIACDEYEYILDGEVCYGSEIPEGATNVHLNYPSTFNHYMIVRAGNKPGASDLTTYLQLYVVKNPENNRHYVSANNTWDENDIILSDIAGAWNHITMVLETNKAKPSESMLRYYCNGVFVCEAKANTKGAEYLNLDSVRFNVSAGVVSSGEHYTFCIDNLACNYYALDYESPADVFGIDDYYANPDHKSVNISSVEDIVYNSSYSYYGTSTPYSAVLEHTDGTVDYTYSIENALGLVKDGDFITLNKDVIDYIPHSQDIKELTFITESNAKFSLAGAAQEFYKLQNSGNRYTLKLASDDAMKLNWYNAEGENREVVKEQKLLPLFVPNDSAPELNIYGAVDKSDLTNPTIQILKKWEWDMDNDGYADGKGLSSLTVADLNELREQGINELSLVPVYETKSLLYEIFTWNEDGELEYFVPDGNYNSLTQNDKFASNVSALKAGTEYFVEILRNIEIENDIQITEGATVNVDFNGCSLIASGCNAFTVRDNATLNIYSSAQNASLIANGGYAITTYKADSCSINVGEFTIGGEEFSGNNITVSAGRIVYPDYANNKQSNGNKVNVNIIGGTYLASDSVAFGCPTDTVYSIENANIIAENIAFSSTEQLVGIRVDIDSSVISSSDFISGWATRGSIAVITNSIISGFSNTNSNVTLGEYNKVEYKYGATIKADGSDIPVASGVLFARANNMAKIEEFEIDGQNYSFDFDVLTYLEGTEVEDFVGAKDVIWLTPDEEVYVTTVWYPGSIAAKVDVDFEDVILNNGWYNRRYNDWQNANEENADSFEIVAEGSNIFKPVANAVVGALDVKISLQVSEVFGYNVYLPAIPDNSDTFEFNGFYIGSTKITNGVFENVTVDGVEGCIRLVDVIGITELKSDEITIKYTVNGTVLQKKITIDIIDYVQQVANAYECGSDECKIVFAMMNYKLESYIASTGVENDDTTLIIRDFLMWHSSDCSCLDFEYTESESAVDYTAIEGKLVGFDYAMTLDSANNYSSKFTFAIQLKKDCGVTAVNGKIVDTAGEFNLSFETSVFDDYVEYRADVDLQYLNQLINLTLTTADGEINASYDLVKHIELFDLDFHKSLYVISAAADAENE